MQSGVGLSGVEPCWALESQWKWGHVSQGLNSRLRFSPDMSPRTTDCRYRGPQTRQGRRVEVSLCIVWKVCLLIHPDKLHFPFSRALISHCLLFQTAPSYLQRLRLGCQALRLCRMPQQRAPNRAGILFKVLPLSRLPCNTLFFNHASVFWFRHI